MKKRLLSLLTLSVFSFALLASTASAADSMALQDIKENIEQNAIAYVTDEQGTSLPIDVEVISIEKLPSTTRSGGTQYSATVRASTRKVTSNSADYNSSSANVSILLTMNWTDDKTNTINSLSGTVDMTKGTLKYSWLRWGKDDNSIVGDTRYSTTSFTHPVGWESTGTTWVFASMRTYFYDTNDKEQNVYISVKPSIFD